MKFTKSARRYNVGSSESSDESGNSGGENRQDDEGNSSDTSYEGSENDSTDDETREVNGKAFNDLYNFSYLFE